MSLAREMLDQIWVALNGAPAAVRQVEFAGHTTMPSCYAMTDLAVASFAAAGLAVAELASNDRTPEQKAASDGAGDPNARVSVNRDLVSAWLRGPARPIAVGDPNSRRSIFHGLSTDFATADGRWIRFQANYPHLRAATVAALGVGDDPAAIAALIRERGADDIEQTIVDNGGAAAASRTRRDWAEHPQGIAVAGEPLIDHTVGTAVPMPRPLGPLVRPLAGIRVLDLTRVLAGPMATRFLAGYGAEVLRLDPPGYAEPGGTGFGDLTLGKRCAALDLSADRDRFLELLAGADVLVHGLRPGALDRLGLDAVTRSAARPGLVEVALNAYGWTGPWRDRRGFDTLVQSSTGMADAGMRWAGQDTPMRWPVSILDHATGYLIAAAVLRGLTRRQQTGHGITSRLALARTAHLLAQFPAPTATDPEMSTLDGPLDGHVHPSALGPVRRVRWPVTIDGIVCQWDRPGDPYGSATPAWLATLG